MDIKKKLLAGSVVGVSLVAGVVAGLPSGALTSGSSTSPTTAPPATVAKSSGPATSGPCDANRDDEWPDRANGVPAGFDAGDTGGVYLWHGPDGWHLRVTHRGDAGRVYTGTIWTAGTIDHVEAVRLEKDDRVQTGPANHLLTFRFVNYGFIDGVDFTTHCADGLHINLKVDGRELPSGRVFVGHTSNHPTGVPFVIRRQDDGRH